MKVIKLFYIVFFVCIVSGLYGEQVRWKIPEGERLEMVRTAAVKYYINAAVQRVYFERNIIDLTCSESSGSGSRVAGTFTVFHKENRQNVFALREQYKVQFRIEQTGEYSVPEKSYMPNLRHIPTFPREEVEPGSKWKAPGELVFNSFSRPFKLTFPVYYTLKKISRKDGDTLAEIMYHYTIDSDIPVNNTPADLPKKIHGKDLGTLVWNISKQRPEAGIDDYKIVFIMKKNNNDIKSVGFEMQIGSQYKMFEKVTEKEKNEARDELKKELHKDKGIDVATDKRGLVIRMGEVLFDFDSYKLRNTTPEKLNRIIDLLNKKYKDREIIVEGHTDNIGSKSYNDKLSLDRARQVAEYLRARLRHDKLSYRGLGADKPIAGNSTKSGRQKNRRVEIIIKLH